jgi:RNA polymerase sigma factor (sigma-70 family)
MGEPDDNDFGRFYRATVAPLRRFLARIVRNPTDAQDLAHDAYQRVYQAMDTGRVKQPQAFLYTTARRLALKQIRRRHTGPISEAPDNMIDLAASSAPGVERVVMARQEWERVESAIAELPPGCRSVLQLSHREGLSHAEIGLRLGIAISTVEKQHARALRLLRGMLHADAPHAQTDATSRKEGGSSAATS